MTTIHFHPYYVMRKWLFEPVQPAMFMRRLTQPDGDRARGHG
ncbi:hypothetical protein [Rugosimonospora africana]|nr:hypothetical protein [Rugosimonospora africana]